MTACLNGTLKETEQNLIVHIGKSEVEVTNNKRLRLRYCTVEANYREAQSIARPLCDLCLSAIAELLVVLCYVLLSVSSVFLFILMVA